jgi:threonine dehydratase
MTIDLTGIFDVTEIWKARKRISGIVYRTPLVYSSGLSERTGSQVYLKMECWQRCGCFKVRGAVNHVSSLTPEERGRGLVTASSGNHALAVAYASQLFGDHPTRIYVPEDADPAKVKRILAWGPDLVYHGRTFQEAFDEAQRYVKENGSVFVHSHADPKVIAGQGTIGLEIMEDLPDAEAVIVPIGGGGLISGISSAVKTVSEDVKIYGVEPTAAPGAYRSLREGVCHETLDVGESIADGLLGGFGRLPFEICRRTVDDTFLVDDGEIAEAMVAFQQEEQVMVEPASSVGLAAMLSGKTEVQNMNVVLVVTSRNIDASRYNQLIQKRIRSG